MTFSSPDGINDDVTASTLSISQQKDSTDKEDIVKKTSSFHSGKSARNTVSFLPISQYKKTKKLGEMGFKNALLLAPLKGYIQVAL